jgi:type IV fimbrial biogenesis protein FimT
MATADVAAANIRGFTLIELMAAIAILALIFLLGMPSFTTFVRNSDIRSTSESIANGLRTASAEATRRNSRVGFTLADAGGGWQIRTLNDGDTDCTDFTADSPIQAFAASETRRGAQVTVTPAGKSSVCFTGLGRVFNQGTADHIRQLDITRSDGGEGRALRIIVDDATRGLRMCDPDPALAALAPPDPRAC